MIEASNSLFVTQSRFSPFQRSTSTLRRRPRTAHTQEVISIALGCGGEDVLYVRGDKKTRTKSIRINEALFVRDLEVSSLLRYVESTTEQQHGLNVRCFNQWRHKCGSGVQSQSVEEGTHSIKVSFPTGQTDAPLARVRTGWCEGSPTM